MQLAIAILIAVGALIFVFTRMQGARKTHAKDEKPSPRRVRQTRRQQKLEKIREYDPLPEPISIFDIMMEEAKDLGLRELPGGDGVEVPVLLKVWKRDEAIRTACGDDVHFVVAAGLVPGEATIDEVSLTCADGSVPEIAVPPIEAAPPNEEVGRGDDDSENADTPPNSQEQSPDGADAPTS